MRARVALPREPAEMARAAQADGGQRKRSPSRACGLEQPPHLEPALLRQCIKERMVFARQRYGRFGERVAASWENKAT